MHISKRTIVGKFGLVYLFFVPLLSFSQSRKPKPAPFTAAKLSVAPIFVGEVQGKYEHSSGKKSTFEIGLGLLTDNYIKNALEEAIAVNARKVVIGPSASIGYRYYPLKKGEQIYFSTEFKYRLYRKRFSQDGGDFVTKEYLQRMMPRVGFGYHLFIDERFFVDFSGNLGFSLDKQFQVGDLKAIPSIKLNCGIGINFSYRLSKVK